MDILLKGKHFNFFIDEIFIANFEEELFGAVVIPNIDSEYFPPNVTRKFYFGPEFLSKDLYESFRSKFPDSLSIDNVQFQSSILQGRFYSIPCTEFPNRKIPEGRLPYEFHRILLDGLVEESDDEELNDGELIKLEDGMKILNDVEHNENKSLRLYCFNVGQGDSFLLIFPNDNVYIIDTNIYSDASLETYINKVWNILCCNNLWPTTIKGLIITHKHADHLRGASKLIQEGSFRIDSFLINYDYVHNSKLVKELLSEAKDKIVNRINVNNVGHFLEGIVAVKINNPDNNTNNKSSCSDVNDSSISLQIQFGESNVILTGDLGFNFIKNKLQTREFNGCTMLKVSHHGSRTGTDEELIDRMDPVFAFISAGDHRGFCHPHEEVTDIFDRKCMNYVISKSVRKTILYEVTEKSIEMFKVNDDGSKEVYKGCYSV